MNRMMHIIAAGIALSVAATLNAGSWTWTGGAAEDNPQWFTYANWEDAEGAAPTAFASDDSFVFSLADSLTVNYNATDNSLVYGSVTFANTTGSALASSIKSVDGAKFSTQALAVGDGMQVTLPLYTSVTGTLTFGNDSQIIFDTSDYTGATAQFTVSAFALPEGDSDVLSHFGVTDNHFAVQLSQDGLTVSVALSTVAATAKWIGAADGDLNDSANWECVNGFGTVLPDALPCEYTRIIASGTLNVPTDAVHSWQYRSFEVTNAVTLAANCDWRGLGAPTMVNSPTVTLGGYNLSTLPPSGTCTVTGSGELHVEVAQNTTHNNNSMTLSGALKLVKEGAGTFISSKTQSYTGGTVVSKGYAQCGISKNPFGTSLSRITVANGAAFNYNGYTGKSDSPAYSFTVCGSGPDGDGAIRSGAVATVGSWYNYNCFADMELTGNTYIKCANANNSLFGFRRNDNGSHTLTMNGYTLTVAVYNKNFAFQKVTTVGDGKIVMAPYGSGTPQPSFYGSASNLGSVTLDIYKDNQLNVEVAVTVGTYIDRRTWDNYSRSGTITVIGRYKPTAVARPLKNIQLGDSTHLSPVFDLTAFNSAFALSSDGRSLSFVNNATVTLDVGSRSVQTGTKLVSWSTAPSNLSTLKFKCVRNSGEELSVARKSDGLYLFRGMVFTVR